MSITPNRADRPEPMEAPAGRESARERLLARPPTDVSPSRPPWRERHALGLAVARVIAPDLAALVLMIGGALGAGAALVAGLGLGLGLTATLGLLGVQVGIRIAQREGPSTAERLARARPAGVDPERWPRPAARPGAPRSPYAS